MIAKRDGMSWTEFIVLSIASLGGIAILHYLNGYFQLLAIPCALADVTVIFRVFKRAEF